MAKPTVLLYPGAGSDRDQTSLVAIERALGAAASVERLDFPYRKEGRKAPDRAPKLMESIRGDLASVRRRRGPVVMGGRSMGGRIASMVAADVDGAGPVRDDAHLLPLPGRGEEGALGRGREDSLLHRADVLHGVEGARLVLPHDLHEFFGRQHLGGILNHVRQQSKLPGREVQRCIFEQGHVLFQVEDERA